MGKIGFPLVKELRKEKKETLALGFRTKQTFTPPICSSFLHINGENTNCSLFEKHLQVKMLLWHINIQIQTLSMLTIMYAEECLQNLLEN